jgi:hypothetical protein
LAQILQEYRSMAHLFIGVLLPDRAQQEYGSDAISNRSLNRISVGTWWIFGWRMKSPARLGLHEEDESGTGSCWPLGLAWTVCVKKKKGRLAGPVRGGVGFRPMIDKRIGKLFHFQIFI